MKQRPVRIHVAVTDTIRRTRWRGKINVPATQEGLSINLIPDNKILEDLRAIILFRPFILKKRTLSWDLSLIITTRGNISFFKSFNRKPRRDHPVSCKLAGKNLKTGRFIPWECKIVFNAPA